MTKKKSKCQIPLTPEGGMYYYQTNWDSRVMHDPDYWFSATLVFTSNEADSSGRVSGYLFKHADDLDDPEGRIYYMFASELENALSHCNVEGRHFTGNWGFVKKGLFFSIVALGPSPCRRCGEIPTLDVDGEGSIIHRCKGSPTILTSHGSVLHWEERLGTRKVKTSLEEAGNE